jgi:hypothetical protein
MTLKLNVGLSKKIGQPDYGSLGASCHIEVELDQMLLFHDLDGLHQKIKQAFVACRQAVQDELYRHEHPDGDQSAGQAAQQPAANGNGHHAAGNGTSANGNGRANGQRGARLRKATTSQVRAIHAIADRLQLDLAGWLQQRYGLHVPGDLSITQASDSIDELKALPSNNGGHQ